jgi:hypothetical protein
MDQDLGQALQYVVQLAPANLHQLPDIPQLPTGTNLVFDKPVYRPDDPSPLPRAAPLGLLTLRSLAQFATDNVDGVDLAKQVIHVEGPCKVSYCSPVAGFHRQREVLAHVTFTPGSAQYIDKWLKLEDAIIGLIAEFSGDGDSNQRQAVIDALKAVKIENAGIHEDDGISQQVTAMVGASLVKTASIPNPIALAPFRTFPEVAQPLSLFVLRLRDGNGGPEVLLKQADGSRWMVEAAANIGTFLTNALKSSGTEGALPQVIF